MTAATYIDAIAYKNDSKDKTWLREITIIASGVAMLSLLAQVYIPLVPVPITGQSLGVLVVGAAFGSRRAIVTTLLYLAIGALGMPVFAEASSGLAVLTGATGGYLFGMVAASWVMGKLSEMKQDRSVSKALVLFTIGHLIIFAGGIAWLSQLMSVEQALQVGLVPFIPGMFVKTAIAALALPTAWKLTKGA